MKNLVIETFDALAQQYTDAYFDDTADLIYVDPFISKLPKGARILEIGCGPGTYTKYLIEKGFKVIAIDLSSELIKIAKQKVPQATYYIEDMQEVSKKFHNFDAIFSAYSLIHIPQKDIIKTLQGFYKILKQNGLLFIMAQKGEPDQIIDEPLDKHYKTFVNFFTEKSLSDFLTEAGFGIISQESHPYDDPDNLVSEVIYSLSKKK